MKVRLNRPPVIFKDFSGVAEVNLKDFVEAYPSQRTVIMNMLGYENGSVPASEFEKAFGDGKNLIHFTMYNGEYIHCEIGYPEDKWAIQKTENTKVFTKEDLK